MKKTTTVQFSYQDRERIARIQKRLQTKSMGDTLRILVRTYNEMLEHEEARNEGTR